MNIKNFRAYKRMLALLNAGIMAMTPVVASASEKAASDTALDGKVISITIDDDEEPTDLKVDYDGDPVVCTPTGTDKNTIISGIITLKSCSVNGNDTTYDYSGGRAQ